MLEAIGMAASRRNVKCCTGYPFLDHWRRGTNPEWQDDEILGNSTPRRMSDHYSGKRPETLYASVRYPYQKMALAHHLQCRLERNRAANEWLEPTPYEGSATIVRTTASV